METFKKIWPLLVQQHRRKAIILLGMMLIGAFLEMLGISLIIPIVALLTEENITQAYPFLEPILRKLDNPDRTELIIGAMLVLVSVYTIKGLFLALLAWQQGRLAFMVHAYLSERLLKIYLQQPYTFHLQRNSAQLIRNIAIDLWRFIDTGLVSLITWFTQALMLLLLGVLLFATEPLSTLAITIMFFVFAGGFHYLSRKRITVWGKMQEHHDGLRIQHLQQSLEGIKEIKIKGCENDFLTNHSVHTNHSTDVRIKQLFIRQLPRLWLEIFVIFSLSLLIIFMLLQSYTFDAILSTLALFAVIIFRTIPSINTLMRATQEIRYNLPVMDRLYNEITFAPPMEFVGHVENINIFSTTIEMINVSYTYPGAIQASLKNVSLLIKKGESVGIVGASGVGKSTLLDLLLGLLVPDKGNIEIDGRDMQMSLQCWQRQIGYVPQSVFLIDDSIRRNIALGVTEEKIDDNAVFYAIKAAQLEQFIAGLPNGVETFVGERGVRLSGGQRQRISIARAIYHNPAVLVLDEATSSLDTDTEKDIVQALASLQRKKTIIVVAHRFSAVQHCDRLYRLHEGRVIETCVPDQKKLNDSTHKSNTKKRTAKT